MNICPMNITRSITLGDLENLNNKKGIVLSQNNIEEINASYYKKMGMNTDNTVAMTYNAVSSATTNAAPSNNAVPIQTKHMILPALTRRASKGQKLPLNFSGNKLRVNCGWNVKNPDCDVDVSAFMLGNNGKVVGDDYFVFYGQETSPERSITFKNTESRNVNELFDIDLSILSPAISKVVFVMTINEALEKSLNFSMISDAYIQIMDVNTGSELASFLVEEYYNNITSMMMGEIYLHNSAWKFNAIGNGVNRDLAGLCELYGVQVV